MTKEPFLTFWCLPTRENLPMSMGTLAILIALRLILTYWLMELNRGPPRISRDNGRERLLGAEGPGPD